MKHKSYMFWINVISVVLGIALVIFLLVKPKETKQNPTPTESEATESIATEQLPTENTGNTDNPNITQTDYPKIDEIEYYFTDGTYDGQPAVLLGYKNNSKYTVTSLQLYFKIKADATPEELALFDPFVSSGALTPEKLSKLSPSFSSEIVCDPGETGEGSPCILFKRTYATDAKQCQILTLNGAAINFLGNDGRIRTAIYTAKDNTYVLGNAKNAASNWTTKYYTKATPKPNTRFFTVNRDDDNHYQFIAYDMTYEQYRAYCKECQASGFTKNIADNGASFTCSNTRGLTINILHHPAKQAMVVNATFDPNDIDPRPAAEKYIAGFAPVLSDQVAQYVQADPSKSVIYERRGGSIIPVPVWLPKLQPFSEDAIACQADIEKDLRDDLTRIEEAANGGYESGLTSITFEANVNGDILSILVKIDYSAGGVMGYCTYNFDITTGKRLDKDALIEKLQITNFDERLSQTARNGFETKYSPVDDESGSFIKQQLNATMDPENLKKAQLYVGADGKLMATIYIYALAGGNGYYELVPFS